MKEVGSSDTTFSIVLEARNNGKRVKRAKWGDSYIEFDPFEGKFALFYRIRHVNDGYAMAWFYPSWEDILADDWQIVDGL